MRPAKLRAFPLENGRPCKNGILHFVRKPGQLDYSDVLGKMQAMGVTVLYYGGFRREAGLIVRQA